MKTRTGFVSNSSSSSFIIDKKYEPEVKEFIQKLCSFIEENELSYDSPDNPLDLEEIKENLEYFYNDCGDLEFSLNDSYIPEYIVLLFRAKFEFESQWGRYTFYN